MGTGQSPASPRPWGRIVLRVALAALAVAALVALLTSAAPLPSADRVRDLGEELGWVAPVVWPPLFAVLNLLVPWGILAGATGLLFGTAAGTPLALGGVLLAAALQFSIARAAVGEQVRHRLLRRVPRLDAMLDRHGFLACFYSRVIPGLAWGPVNYAAGIARVRLRTLLLATVAGGTPKVFAYVALGGSLDDLSRPEAKVAIGLLVVLALAGVVIARRGFAGRPAPPSA